MANEEQGFNQTFNVSQVQTMVLEDYSDIQREGTAVIRPINERKEGGNHPHLTVRGFKNPLTGKWFGIPTKKNPDGSYVFQKLTIDGHKTFVLKNEKEAIEFHIWKNSAFVRGSELSKIAGIKPTFMIYNQEEEAEAIVKKSFGIADAIKFVQNLTDEEVKDFGGLFMINPSTNKPKVIQSMLLEKCIKNPENILEKMQDQETTALYKVLRRAIFSNLVTEELGKGFLYKGGMSLGMSEINAIEFLRKDPRFTSMLNEESKEQQKKGVVVSTLAGQNLPGAEVKKAMDEAKDRMAERERMKQEIMAEMGQDIKRQILAEMNQDKPSEPEISSFDGQPKDTHENSPFEDTQDVVAEMEQEKVTVANLKSRKGKGKKKGFSARKKEAVLQE